MTKFSYSFIKPQVKPIFSLFSIIWICLICGICVTCIFVDIGIKLLSYNLEQSNIKNQASYDDYSRKIVIIKDHIQSSKEQQEAADEIFATNNALKNSIRNIFDIVPDTITLNSIELNKNNLSIKGKTPSKEAFLLLMEAPLKSIFANTKTNFYQLENGWLNFTSINTNEDDF